MSSVYEKNTSHLHVHSLVNEASKFTHLLESVKVKKLSYQ